MGIPVAIRGPSDTRLAPEIPFYLNLYLNSLLLETPKDLCGFLHFVTALFVTNYAAGLECTKDEFGIFIYLKPFTFWGWIAPGVSF